MKWEKFILKVAEVLLAVEKQYCDSICHFPETCEKSLEQKHELEKQKIDGLDLAGTTLWR